VNKIFTISIVLLLISFTSIGQILNIEKFRIDKDTSNVWGANVGFGFSTKKQQTSVTTLNANANIVYLSKKHSYITINYIKFVGIENVNPLSEGYTHWRLTLLRQKFMSYEPFIQWQYDKGRGLLKRKLYGGTIRLNVLKTKKTMIAFNTGAMYEYELWRGEVIRYPLENTQDSAQTQFLKSTNSITVRGDVTPNVNVFLVSYYQARFDRFFSPRIISEIQVNVKINKYFSISNQFTSTYDAIPILKNNTFIYSYTTNLLFKL
jgi:putative salt-induced outer membrane protein YdiY